MENANSFTKFVFVVAVVSCCFAHYCKDNISVAELPNDIYNDVVLIASREAIKVPDCSNVHVKKSLINFRLYNYENPENPINLNENGTEGPDLDKGTIILIPGWICNMHDRMPQLISAYLQKYDCNVIGIDWSAYSIDSYANAYCSAQLVAKHVAEYICDNDLQINDIHIVGHSMGGQMAGLIGQEVKRECSGEITRITALDPAGPIYQTQSNEYRLDKDDARSVDVIHTDMGVFGYAGVCGTTDFFPNCGKLQPGCPSIEDVKRSDLGNLPLSYVNCDHLRSADYMIESVNSNGFAARSTAKMPLVCMKSYIFYTTAIMGEGCDASSSARKYLLWTNSRPPYAQGAI